MPVPLSDPRAQSLDFILIRESTEGLFSSRGHTEFVDGRARRFLEITRPASERLFDYTLALGRRREGISKVTCVDKSNVLGAFAFFREIFQERAAAFPTRRTATTWTPRRSVWSQSLDLRRGRHREHVRRHPVRRRCLARRNDSVRRYRCGQGCLPALPARHPTSSGPARSIPRPCICPPPLMLDWLGEQHGSAGYAMRRPYWKMRSRAPLRTEPSIRTKPAAATDWPRSRSVSSIASADGPTARSASSAAAP